MDSTPIKRRLAAILAADAVAYSKHMAEDEEGTLHTLAGHRTIIDGLIASFDGRIVGTAGDSVLGEFGSSVDAVRCAVEIQQALATRNNSLAEADRLLFRIGINLGDVIVEGNDILGDGVNVAARLESIADPGGICISSSIYDQITGKLNLGFADMGQQSLKNIARPVRTYRLDRDGAPARPHAHTASGAGTSGTSRSPMVMVAAAVALVAVIGGAWMMTRRAQRTTARADAAARQAGASDNDSRTRLLTAEAEKARAEAELARAQLAAATQAAASKPAAAPPPQTATSTAAPTRPAASPPAPSSAVPPASAPNAVPPSAAPPAPAASAPEPVTAESAPARYTGGTAEFHCENGDELADGRGVVRVANNIVTIDTVAPGRGTTVTARGRLQDDGTLTVQVVGPGRGQRGGRQGGGGAGVFSGRLVNGRGTLTGPQGRCTVALALN